MHWFVVGDLVGSKIGDKTIVNNQIAIVVSKSRKVTYEPDRNLFPPEVGRCTAGGNSRAEAFRASVRVVFVQIKSAQPAVVAVVAFNVHFALAQVALALYIAAMVAGTGRRSEVVAVAVIRGASCGISKKSWGTILAHFSDCVVSAVQTIAGLRVAFI